jgi:hypothetical protein
MDLKKIALIIIAAALLAATAVTLRLPSAAAQNAAAGGSQQLGGGFQRFIPDAAGEIAWVLKGTMAKFLANQMIEIVSLFAQSHERQVGDLKIEVERVVFNTRTNDATAEGERVTVRREGMVLTGRGIVWNPKSKTIRVMEDVKVLIKEQGNLGLFPL